MSPRSGRKGQQANLQAGIKEVAWKLIARFGVPAISLRAIARELNITAPAIYNYYASRDELVTALIVDAYTSFGDSQIEARDLVPVEDLRGRMRAIGLEYRRWAITHPQHYQLIFGAPVPGYQAPADKVLPAGARSLSALVSVIEALRVAGRLRVNAFPEVRTEYKARFETWKHHMGEAGILSLSVALLVWARVHGLVSLEIAGKMPPFGADGGALYLYELAAIERQFIKE